MTTPTVRLAEAEQAFLSRRFEEEMVASTGARSAQARRVHAELACRYAMRVAELENQALPTQPELPYSFEKQILLAS